MSKYSQGLIEKGDQGDAGHWKVEVIKKINDF
jgi:hypothetical protein